MTEMVYTILGTLAGMNEYSKAQRANKYIGADMKKEMTKICALSDDVRFAAKIPEEAYPVHVHIDFYEPNRRRDPDNVTSAKKFILDGLQDAGVITNDGWLQISGFSDDLYLDKENPRVVVTLSWVSENE